MPDYYKTGNILLNKLYLNCQQKEIVSMQDPNVGTSWPHGCNFFFFQHSVVNHDNGLCYNLLRVYSSICYFMLSLILLCFAFPLDVGLVAASMGESYNSKFCEICQPQ